MGWPERFLAFFKKIRSPLHVVLNADGCREGWLQGEFYRHFNGLGNGFRVNCPYCGSRAKHDLFCERPKGMVAELKVYGLSGYYPKNLCGPGNINRFIPSRNGTRRSLSQKELELQRLPAALEKYMILVLQEADEPDVFGRAILAVQVSSQEYEWRCKDFRVRVSRL